MKELKVAIVHDWLVAYAGADRVVEQLHQIFPQAPIYTLIYRKQSMPKKFETYDIRTTYLQKIPFIHKLYKYLLTWMPRAFEQLDLSEYDLVVSSCSSCSKGVITRPDALHICYCHTPTRYIWDFFYTYMNNAGWFKRMMMGPMIHRMRIWDRLAADRVDEFIGNSNYIANRIQKYYRREAKVIYPGVRLCGLPALDRGEDYYLMVGRFTFYKRFDLGVRACTKLKRRLIVVGYGDEEKKLRANAGETVEFRGSLSDQEIMNLYRHAKAFLFPGEEDFGMTPVEAQSAGCPVLAYGSGGACETVADGRTGLLFAEQSVQSLMDCICRFEDEGVNCTRAEIQQNMQRFSQERFTKEMTAFCKEKLDAYRQKNVVVKGE
ncbi:MAG: glycosyltransferase [Eubacteriales bacterium]|nr:glycosyltransferase [Eubacteriales bacterium]